MKEYIMELVGFDWVSVRELDKRKQHPFGNIFRGHNSLIFIDKDEEYVL
jgi:hypothetical protein